jgi:hypothetical protein
LIIRKISRKIKEIYLDVLIFGQQTNIFIIKNIFIKPKIKWGSGCCG